MGCCTSVETVTFEVTVDWDVVNIGGEMHVEPKCKVTLLSHVEICSNSPVCKWKRGETLCSKCKISYGQLRFTKKREECPICYETRKRVLLRCGHSTCGKCMRRMIEKTPKALICPLCRGDNLPKIESEEKPKISPAV